MKRTGKLQRSTRRVALSSAVAALAVAMFATAAPAQESLVVGSKNFSGAIALSQAYGQALEAKDFDIEFKDNIGTTEVVYPSLESGDLDAYAEYQGTLLIYLGGEPTADSAETYAALQEQLDGTGIVATKPAPAVDVNGFYVTKKTAKKYKLKTMSDLVPVSDQLVFGTTPECDKRPLCLGDTSQELYGFDFEEVKKLDEGGPITVKALEDGDIDVALLFTGSSVIPKNAVLLEDDKGLQPADNPVLLIREEQATPQVLKAANAVSKKMTTKAYNEMTLKISEEKEDPADAASEFLEANNLN
jgi:osmoprotectant transport system substrate-binding protein